MFSFFCFLFSATRWYDFTGLGSCQNKKLGTITLFTTTSMFYNNFYVRLPVPINSRASSQDQKEHVTTPMRNTYATIDWMLWNFEWSHTHFPFRGVEYNCKVK
jgi:hypothetical protein